MDPDAPAAQAGGVTRRLAVFAARLRFDALPATVVDGVKLHVLDAVDCGITGADSDLAEAAFRFLEHGAGGCPVLGTDWHYGPAAAAFANSVAMNALDYDDGHEVDGKETVYPDPARGPRACPQRRQALESD